MNSAQEIKDQFLASLKYCLHCEKTGHQTTECWSTHGLNTARDLEIHRLCMTASAQPAEEVQPVAWRIPINGMYEFFNSEADAIAERKEYDGGDPPMFAPEALYTRPPAADADRLDAERWRFARDRITTRDLFGGDSPYLCYEPDQAIDAALAASKEKKE